LAEGAALVEIEKVGLVHTSRFHCASGLLQLRRLAKHSQTGLWAALLLSVSGHSLLSLITGKQADRQSARPLTTQFVKRQPRLTKPLELKKLPRPKRRLVQREMVAVRARASHREAALSAQTAGVVQTLARPRVNLSRAITPGIAGREPEALASAIDGSMMPQDKVSMDLDMMDVNALDTGEYHAMVVQDASDRRNIKGFFHMARAYPGHLFGKRKVGDDIRSARAVARLAEALNRFTRIKADLTGSFPVDSVELFKTPWIYVQARYPFELTASEERNLGRYLLSGGFLVADTVLNGPDRPAEPSLMDLIKKPLDTQSFKHGRDWDFQVIPHSHAVYHCFFDFPNGPPPCGEFWYISGRYPGEIYKNLHGVFREGRLIAVLSRIWLGNA